MEEKYDNLSEDIAKKIQIISSPSLKAKLIEINTITNILLFDKEDKFHDEYKEIRGRYENNSFNIYKKISDIIHGKLNPNDLLTEDDYNKYNIIKDNNEDKETSYINIKDFWLISLKNCDYFNITEYEEKILKYLKDITIKLHENKVDLTLSYSFDENEFFKNKFIRKHYFYNSANEKLIKTEFDDILWNKNISNNMSKNKNENKKNFFDMFNKNKINNDLDENEANFIKNDFLPRILEYYLNLVQYKKKKDDLEDNIIGTFNANKINIKTIK